MLDRTKPSIAVDYQAMARNACASVGLDEFKFTFALAFAEELHKAGIKQRHTAAQFRVVGVARDLAKQQVTKLKGVSFESPESVAEQSELFPATPVAPVMKVSQRARRSMDIRIAMTDRFDKKVIAGVKDARAGGYNLYRNIAIFLNGRGEHDRHGHAWTGPRLQSAYHAAVMRPKQRVHARIYARRISENMKNIKNLSLRQIKALRDAV